MTLPSHLGIMLSPDPAKRYGSIQTFWHAVHRLINDNQLPEDTINRILKLVGEYLGADRAYTFAVTTDRLHTSCTYEWTSEPEFSLHDVLQNIDQRGLQGWLDRFNTANKILISDVDNPPPDLVQPAAKFKRDMIRSIYVFGFFDEGRLVGYLGVDYVKCACELDEVIVDVLYQLASTLNLYILRHETLEMWNRMAYALPSALFIKDVDNDLRYMFVNPRYRNLFGKNIIGHTDLELYGPIHGATFRKEDMQCLKTGKPFLSDGPQSDISQKAKGYFSQIKFPVTTKMGGRYIVGFLTDITNEHELSESAFKLLEQAKAAEKAKSLFLASMSHEIRTPLNAILGLANELQHNDVTPADRQEYLQAISTAGTSLLALINDVLDMSKLEAGQMQLSPTETDFPRLISTCALIFRESCKSKGISIACDFTGTWPRLSVDNTRIKQIVFNLVGNAIKFTKEGGITIGGSFKKTDEKTGVLSFYVRDTGIGIAEEDRGHVFGLFEQASAVRGTRVANKGTGLGLCLCKRLAERLGGDIKLDSELGKGSTFTITLNNIPFIAPTPARADVPTNPSLANAQSENATTGNTFSTPHRVVIVDDVPINLKVLGLILKRAHIATFPANSADEALSILKADSSITAVLTDMWMPKMNGEDLARAIRKNPAWNHIRIAAQTADVEASHNFETSLFDAVLSKPITAEKVLGFLNR